MFSFRPTLLKFVFAFLLVVLVTPSSRGLQAGEVTRSEAMQTAAAYQNFAWTPGPQNVFHGKDRRGVRVDTPDVSFQRAGTRPGWWLPGTKNFGVPYQWGGFSSLEEFAAGLRAGRPAGDVYSPEKRRQLDAAVSREAVGIDCSGLISRCWKLDHAYSTRTLPELCDALASYGDLRPGDILNLHNDHVLLFKGWKDPAHERLYAYEAGSPPYWKVLLNDIPTALLQSQGFKPFRYRKMRD